MVCKNSPGPNLMTVLAAEGMIVGLHSMRIDPAADVTHQIAATFDWCLLKTPLNVQYLE
jgi:hypothetical protein